MTHALRHCFRKCGALTGFAVGSFVLFQTILARSLAPDIPQNQAGTDKETIQHEIQLGTAYLAGHGVAQDQKLAAYWYEKAANAGDPFAQNQIGYLYQVGLGDRKS